jgi:hypothetical protein
VTMTVHPHLVPRFLMSRSYTSSSPCASIGVLWDCFTFTEIYERRCYLRVAGVSGKFVNKMPSPESYVLFSLFVLAFGSSYGQDVSINVCASIF